MENTATWIKPFITAKKNLLLSPTCVGACWHGIFSFLLPHIPYIRYFSHDTCHIAHKKYEISSFYISTYYLSKKTHFTLLKCKIYLWCKRQEEENKKRTPTVFLNFFSLTSYFLSLDYFYNFTLIYTDLNIERLKLVGIHADVFLD